MIKRCLKKVEKSLNEKMFFTIAVIVAIVCIIPIFAYACYTVPLADDYNMMGPAYLVWLETHSVLSAILTAWEQAMMRYTTWAGEYLCMFLQGLPIAAGGYRYYFVSAWVVIVTYIFAVYYMGKILLIDCLKANKKQWFIISTVIFVFMTEFLPDIYDAFYWYTASISYTFSFAVKMILLAAVFKELFLKCETKKWKAILLVCACFLAAGFEGSFSQTSFFLIIVGMGLVKLVQKERKVFSGILMLTTTIGWGIVLLAPGNMARQTDNYGSTTGAVAVIWESLQRGVESISDNLNLMLVLGTLLIIPSVAGIVKKSSYTFKLPGLVCIYSIGIYASQFAPWIFSRGVEAPSPYGGDSGYVLNVFWMTFVLLWFFNVCYCTGWIMKNRKEKEDAVFKKVKYGKISYFGICILLLAFWSMNLEHVMEYQSPRLIWHIAKGNAKAYYVQMEAREEAILNSTQELLVVPAVDMPIPTCGAGDIVNDENHWVNRGISAYYRLESGIKTSE